MHASQLSDHELLDSLRSLIARERKITAAVLAHLAEVDERRLYLPAGYPSMYAWCVGALGLSEQSAFKRIRVARLARRVPAVYALAREGRLNLSALVLLSPHVTTANADELFAAAEGKRREQIELLLAQRFPQPDLATLIEPISPVATPPESAAPEAVHQHETKLSPGIVERPSASAPPARVQPLAPQRYGLQVTLAQETYDRLRRAQELLGHVIAPNDVAAVLDRALKLLVAHLERSKCGAATKARAQSCAPNGRHVPAAIRREVWHRDGGRCTFFGSSGHRCDERSRLEFDHVAPVARGGDTSVANLRLRCRAHNQYEADRLFGAKLMRNKRRPGSSGPTTTSAPPEHSGEGRARP